MLPATLTDSLAQPLSALRRILVIDDDESFRLLLRTLLERAGHEVIEASKRPRWLAPRRATPCRPADHGYCHAGTGRN
jgi:PleD family two-component response regulator